MKCRGFGPELAFTYTVANGPKGLIVSTDYPETTVDTILYVEPDFWKDFFFSNDSHDPAGGWWQRWVVGARFRRLWRLAFGTRAVPVHPWQWPGLVLDSPRSSGEPRADRPAAA